MPQEYKVQEAIRQAIVAKKNLLDFYRQAAELIRNPKGREVFLRLSEEVLENTRRFFPYYRGNDLGSFEQFMNAPPAKDSAMLAELRKALDVNMHERRAREIALAEEQDLERNFRMTAARIVDPAARAVFEKVAEETRNHYLIIESEYSRTMAMVHETDMDIYVRE
ncbi:ferritin [Desulfuromonas versatilis]|uniref:Ferritin n=1 Tax=Desulfuromonas versatilis TaxID=2802975 RepID=A0ABN6DT20_9BACT|nr:ferritin family protein [Desulfuromonas versatilis]BCR03318.1 ferritin [Desulfuromonas versatilis]